MTEFIIHNMAPIMFASLVVFLLLGYPVAFSLAAIGLGYAVIGIELGLFNPNFLNAMPDRMLGIFTNEILLAIPFFTFMGMILERSGMAEDLLDTIGQLFGPIPGGLAYAVVFVGAILAATTGVVAASVISMGLISLPIMLRYGYDRRLACGVIAASGTLAQIIPPSLVLIIMADQLGRSVGDMYHGAIIPGLVLSGLYFSYVLLVTIFFKNSAPALPPEARIFKEADGSTGVKSLVATLALTVIVGVLLDMWLQGKVQNGAGILATAGAVLFSFILVAAGGILKLRFFSKMTSQVIFVLVPPLTLIFLVLGTIFLGICTPTEGGAAGAVGALIMAAMKKKLSFKVTRQAVEATAKLSAFVIFILVGARVFTLTFFGVDGHKWVEELLTGLPGGATGFLIVVNTMVFILSFFLDFFELAFIIIPLLGPAAENLGIDLIWFGVIMAVNMQTSFMHPPFGFALFYLRSVAPKVPYLDKVTGIKMDPVTTGQIYWGAVPFVCIQIVMVGLVIAFPKMVTHYKDDAPKVDLDTLDIQAPGFQLPAQMGLPPISFD